VKRPADERVFHQEIKMAPTSVSAIRTISYVKLVDNFVILNPDLGSRKVASSIECTVVCLILKQCTTVDMILLRNGTMICQLSNKIGTCMEKRDVLPRKQCRMYRYKVRISSSAVHYSKGRGFEAPLLAWIWTTKIIGPFSYIGRLLNRDPIRPT
jgi:hypothetical protein